MFKNWQSKNFFIKKLQQYEFDRNRKRILHESKLPQNRDPIQRLLAVLRPLLDFKEPARDDGDLCWIQSSVPMTAFSFPNFPRGESMGKWTESDMVKVHEF